jgi:STE24 endopeptidase
VALVLALVAVGMFVASPAQNTVSRAIEARADRTGLTATGDAAAFEAVQRQLALRSLADPTPPAWSQFWFGSHPTVLQRLGLPRSLERADQ